MSTSPTGAPAQPISSTRRLTRVCGGDPEQRGGHQEAEGEEAELSQAVGEAGRAGLHVPGGELRHPVDDERAGEQDGERGQDGAERAVEQAGVRGAEDGERHGEGGEGRQQGLDHLVALGELDEREDDEGADRGGGDVGPAGLEDERDADGEHGPREGDEPRGLLDGTCGRRCELVTGGGDGQLVVQQLVADQADARRLVQAQAGGGRAVGGRARRG